MGRTLLSVIMASRVVTEQGKTRDEAELRLKTKYPNTTQEILFERTYRDGWKFWTKNWELKALIQDVVKESEQKDNIEDKGKVNIKKQKAANTKQEAEKKKALLELLQNPKPDAEEKNIETLMKTIDTLIKKLDNDDRKKTLPLPLEKMETYLVDQEVDRRTARIYVESIEEKFKNTPVIDDADVNKNIRSLIENQINVMGPIKSEEKRIIAVVGPTGVGKTTTLAKIGWELSTNNKTVGFITTDTFRSGAKEQLEQYAQKMDAETIVAKSAKELKEAIQYYQNVNKVDHILIDTVGRNPLENQSIESVKEYLEIAQPQNPKEMLTCIVVSSTSKVRDLKETLGRFGKVKLDSMIFTKLDETYNVGSILNVFNFTKLPLLYVTDGQDITKNIYAPSKRMLSDKILDKESNLEGKILA